MRGKYKKRAILAESRKSLCIKKTLRSCGQPEVSSMVPSLEPCSYARYVRLPVGLHSQASTAEGESYALPQLVNEDGTKIDVKILRPRMKEENGGNVIFEKDGYRLFHLQKTEDLWNDAIQGHRKLSPLCTGRLEWHIPKEIKWGLCWKECLTCTICKYTSPIHKLYKEVNKQGKGRKAGAPNRSLQVGLSHTMISNSAMRDIMLALGIPAPASSSMQRQANQVGEIIQSVNTDDMNQRLGSLVNTIQTATGQTNVAPIMAEGDARYNNALSTAGGKTPFQPATQAVYTVSEHVSPNKKIVGLVCKNKLCKTAQLLRRRYGKTVTCPNHRGHCSANLGPSETIGNEEAWASEVFEGMLNEHPTVAVKYFTTDGDSRAFSGLEKTQKHLSQVKPEHLRDTRHLTVNLRRQIKKAKFSRNMFPGPTMTLRDKQLNFFAQELSQRCAAEFQACINKVGRGDVTKLEKALSNVPRTLIQCYQGDCSQCNEYSYVCGSKHGEHRWDKPYVMRDCLINPTSEDEVLLLSCIAVRLGPSAIRSTKLNTNSQKSEAIHRSYSRCNPKIVTFSRNFPSRIHSATHLVNSGIGTSTKQKCAAVGSPIFDGTRVSRQLQVNEKRTLYHSNRQKTELYKVRRSGFMRKKFSSYQNKIDELHYAKGLLDTDHDYALQGKTSGRPQITRDMRHKTPDSGPYLKYILYNSP